MPGTRDCSPGRARRWPVIAVTVAAAMLGSSCAGRIPGGPIASTPTPGHTGLPEGATIVTRDNFAGHVEPDVAIDTRDPLNLLGACQFEVGSRVRLPGTFASFDGGRSWADHGLLPLPAGYGQGADTTVAFDQQGTGFVVALLAQGGGGYPSRVRRGGIFLWRTANGGRTFAAPRPIYAGAGFQDHPWLAISSSGAPVLFVAWTNSHGLQFSDSHDQGTSWSTPRLLAPGTAPGNPVVTTGAGRTVHVFFEEFAGLGRPIRLFTMTSTDDGSRFSAAELIGTAPAPPSFGRPKGNGVTPPPLLGAASDPATGRSAVAIAGQDPAAGHPVIYLWQTATTTGTWASPTHPVTGRPAAQTQAQPRMIYVHHVLYLSYFSISRTGDVTEQLAHQTSAHEFQPSPLGDPPFRAAGFIGDYQALASAQHQIYALWNDGRAGKLEIVEKTTALR